MQNRRRGKFAPTIFRVRTGNKIVDGVLSGVVLLVVFDDFWRHRHCDEGTARSRMESCDAARVYRTVVRIRRRQHRHRLVHRCVMVLRLDFCGWQTSYNDNTIFNYFAIVSTKKPFFDVQNVISFLDKLKKNQKENKVQFLSFESVTKNTFDGFRPTGHVLLIVPLRRPFLRVIVLRFVVAFGDLALEINFGLRILADHHVIVVGTVAVILLFHIGLVILRSWRLVNSVLRMDLAYNLKIHFQNNLKINRKQHFNLKIKKWNIKRTSIDWLSVL